jgi:hypothetical protein
VDAESTLPANTGWWHAGTTHWQRRYAGVTLDARKVGTGLYEGTARVGEKVTRIPSGTMAGAKREITRWASLNLS